MRQKVVWWLRLVVCWSLAAMFGLSAYVALTSIGDPRAPGAEGVWKVSAVLAGLFFAAGLWTRYPRAKREPAEPPSILRPQRRG